MLYDAGYACRRFFFTLHADTLLMPRHDMILCYAAYDIRHACHAFMLLKMLTFFRHTLIFARYTL